MPLYLPWAPFKGFEFGLCKIGKKTGFYVLVLLYVSYLGSRRIESVFETV
jgi:hypothetical protein